MKNKKIKNLKINKEFVSTFFEGLATTIVVCGLIFDGAVVLSGITAEINLRENSKVNTKSNKQYVTRYEDKNSDIVYSVPDGYPLEGTRRVKNVFVLNPNCMIYDAHTKVAPKGYHKEIVYDDFGYIVPDYYHLEMIDGVPYAVYNSDNKNSVLQEDYTLEARDNTVYAVRRSVNKVKPTIETVDGVVTYSLPEGYSLEGNVGVREVTEYTQPSKTLTKTK